MRPCSRNLGEETRTSLPSAAAAVAAAAVAAAAVAAAYPTILQARSHNLLHNIEQHPDMGLFLFLFFYPLLTPTWPRCCVRSFNLFMRILQATCLNILKVCFTPFVFNFIRGVFLCRCFLYHRSL
jgi:hypothetical protein